MEHKQVICDYSEHCYNDCKHNEPHEERIIYNRYWDYCTEEHHCDINQDGSEIIKVRCVEYHED